MTSDLAQIREERSLVMGEFVREMRSYDSPKPGYWLIKQVKNGPSVPARIWFERHPDHDGAPDPWCNAENRILGIFAEIAGKPVNPEEVWYRHGAPITEAEFRYQTDNVAWARAYAPAEPIANPGRPVSLRDAPIPF